MIATDWQIQPGPCLACGATNYPLSMGGPGICPACDCYPPERRVGQLAVDNRELRSALEWIREFAAKTNELGIVHTGFTHIERRARAALEHRS